MGCDIHIVLERRLPGKEWVGLYATDYHPGGRLSVAKRDYEFFAEIASVRGSRTSRKTSASSLGRNTCGARPITIRRPTRVWRTFATFT